ADPGHPHLRCGVRDVPGQRHVAHAARAVERDARDPALPVRRAARALSPGARGALHDGHAARAARRPRAGRGRRGPRADAADPGLGLDGAPVRAAAGAARGPSRLRVDRPQSAEDLLRRRPPRVVTELAAPLDAYRDVVRPEWIDHNGHMNMGYYLVVFDFATDAPGRSDGAGDRGTPGGAPGRA